MNLLKTIVFTLSLWCIFNLDPTWATETSPSATTPQATIVTAAGKPVDLDPLILNLAQQQIVYLGETHDRAIDHQIQLEIIQKLHRSQPNLTIAFEQFQRPYQSVLNNYQNGKITEAQLLEQSEYVKRWGFSWVFYAPILQFAKNNQIPLIALNTPSEVTRKVSRQGLDSLTFTDRRFIPPLSEISIGPESYRDRLQKIYREMHQGKGNSQGFNRFFEAQILWDETMADRLAQATRQNPDRLIIVLVGQGHLLYQDGIPQRVLRRVRSAKFSQPFQPFQQTTILLNPDPSWDRFEPSTQQPIADILWSIQPSDPKP